MANVGDAHLAGSHFIENQIAPKWHHSPPRRSGIDRITPRHDRQRVAFIQNGREKSVGNNAVPGLPSDIKPDLLEIAQTARGIPNLHAKPSRRRASAPSIPSPRSNSASASARGLANLFRVARRELGADHFRKAALDFHPFFLRHFRHGLKNVLRGHKTRMPWDTVADKEKGRIRTTRNALARTGYVRSHFPIPSPAQTRYPFRLCHALPAPNASLPLARMVRTSSIASASGRRSQA